MNELAGVTTSRGAVSVLFDDYLARNNDSRGNMSGAEKNTEIKVLFQQLSSIRFISNYT